MAVREGGELHYLYGDHLGSTSLTLNAAGQVVAQRRYEAYGQGRWSRGVEQTDFGFNSHREESEFGLYDYQARYYSPLLGRFISADTIVPDFSNPQALNRYAYVYNNPLNYIDPSGHDPWWLQEPWRQTTDQYDFNLPSYASSYAEQARVASYYGWTPPLEIIPNSQPIARSSEDQRQAIEMGIGMACEPCDWALTLNRWRQGDFSGWDVVGMAAPIISAKAARKLGEGSFERKLPRFNGTKPEYQVNPAHVAGRGLRRSNPKTPLPDDAATVYQRAIPDDPIEPNHWYGVNANGQVYRFSPSRDGTAHFNGIHGVGDGINSYTRYAKERLQQDFGLKSSYFK